MLPSCVSNPFVRGDSGRFGNAPDCRCAVNFLTQFIGADILKAVGGGGSVDGPDMIDPERIDEDRIDEAVLALLYLGLHQKVLAWKGFDWAAMERLHHRASSLTRCARRNLSRLRTRDSRNLGASLRSSSVSALRRLSRGGVRHTEYWGGLGQELHRYPVESGTYAAKGEGEMESRSHGGGLASRPSLPARSRCQGLALGKRSALTADP